jgi:aerobic-type carbon monoxide dehydrogenase small subunit (CoxS/CutS family)
MKIDLTVNGRRLTVDVHPMERLLDVLRDELGLVGTKEGCGEGECGACTVLIDDELALSCLVPVIQCEGRHIETVEGIAEREDAQEFLGRFVDLGGVQCGACTPGVIVTAWKLIQEKTRREPEAVRTALAGNLCRCTGYEAILRAVQEDRGT